MKKLLAVLSSLSISFPSVAALSACVNLFEYSAPPFNFDGKINIPTSYQVYGDFTHHEKTKASVMFSSIRQQMAEYANVNPNELGLIIKQNNDITVGADYNHIHISMYKGNNLDPINQIMDRSDHYTSDDSTLIDKNQSITVQISIADSIYFNDTNKPLLFRTTVLSEPSINNVTGLPENVNGIKVISIENSTESFLTANNGGYAFFNENKNYQYQKSDKLDQVIKGIVKFNKQYFAITNDALWTFNSIENRFDKLSPNWLSSQHATLTFNAIKVFNDQIYLGTNYDLFSYNVKSNSLSPFIDEDKQRPFYDQSGNANVKISVVEQVIQSKVDQVRELITKLYVKTDLNNSKLSYLSVDKETTKLILQTTNIDNCSLDDNHFIICATDYSVYLYNGVDILISDDGITFNKLSKQLDNIQNIITVNNGLYVLSNNNLYVYEIGDKFVQLELLDSDNKILNLNKILNKFESFCVSNNNIYILLRTQQDEKITYQVLMNFQFFYKH